MQGVSGELMDDQLTLDSVLQDTKPDYSALRVGTYWFMLGFEKTGKTTACTTFSPKGEDGVLILDLEQGVRTSKRLSIPISSANPPLYEINGQVQIVPPINRGMLDQYGKPIPSYSLIEVIDMLDVEWKNSGKTTLVLDTADKLSDWCNQLAFEEILREDARSKDPKYKEAQGPEDIKYGLCYARARLKAAYVLDRLLDIVKDSGMLILTSHLKKTLTITEARDVIIKRLPKMPEGLASMLGHGAEAICTIEVDQNGKHWCDFRGYSEVINGTRIEPLSNKRLMWSKEGTNTLYNVVMEACNKWKKETK